MIATDIKEYREERPRFYGYMRHTVKGWYGGVRPNPCEESSGGFTFTIPSAAEQRLLEEREGRIQELLGSIEDGDGVTYVAKLATAVLLINRQLAELRGGK